MWKVLVGLGVIACASFMAVMILQQQPTNHVATQATTTPVNVAADKLETATFGSGCFWCTEAVFQRLKGVQSVTSGYSGGNVPNASYGEVCGGNTGHAEVIQVKFDPQVISFADLLEVFWKSHDPTTKDRQGPDSGSQYRSVIFYHSDAQRKLADEYKAKLDKSGAFDAPIVTEIVAFAAFYPAEDYHQNYYSTHKRQPYCQRFIGPKMDKLKKVFADKLKPEAGE